MIYTNIDEHADNELHLADQLETIEYQMRDLGGLDLYPDDLAYDEALADQYEQLCVERDKVITRLERDHGWWF